MFGVMDAVSVLGLSERETLNEAAAKLLEFAEFPKILRWIQFPTAVVVFLAHPDALDCGAIYVYNRKRCVWLWVDFNDRNYGGYSFHPFFEHVCNQLKIRHYQTAWQPFDRKYFSFYDCQYGAVATT